MDVDLLFEPPADPSRLPPEERVLLAALDCISESGLEGTTVRAIAARAGLNAASVNYYFRSKDKLIETALRRAWQHVSEDMERIRAATSSPAEALEAATRFMLEGAFRYPKLIRAIIVEHPSLRVEAASYFRSLFEELVRRGGGGEDPGLGATLLLSFAVFLGIAPDAACALTGMDLQKAPARDRLAALVSPRFFTS